MASGHIQRLNSTQQFSSVGSLSVFIYGRGLKTGLLMFLKTDQSGL